MVSRTCDRSTVLSGSTHGIYLIMNDVEREDLRSCYATSINTAGFTLECLQLKLRYYKTKQTCCCAFTSGVIYLGFPHLSCLHVIAAHISH